MLKINAFKLSRGISQVITSILLILISIVGVIIISGLVIPFVRDSLGESKECFEVIDQLTINTESGYTCYYNNTINKMIANVTIKRGTGAAEINGFIIAISGGGSSKTFEIKNGTVKDVKMIDGSADIKIPGKGEEMTYSMNTSLDEVRYAEIAPIMASGRICKATDKKEIERCQTF